MNSKISPSLTAVAVAVTTFALVAFAEPAPATNRAARKPALVDSPALVSRGNYLVHQVGMCIDCHSPRGERGEFLEDKHLTGSALPFAPSVPMPAWAPAAPHIAGLPSGWSEDQMVHFLMTGERPNNLPPPMPPMPPYRMNKADAEAVAAYVHSLGNGSR